MEFDVVSVRMLMHIIAQIHNTFLTTDRALTISLLKQFEKKLLLKNFMSFTCPLLPGPL